MVTGLCTCKLHVCTHNMVNLVCTDMCVQFLLCLYIVSAGQSCFISKPPCQCRTICLIYPSHNHLVGRGKSCSSSQPLCWWGESCSWRIILLHLTAILWVKDNLAPSHSHLVSDGQSCSIAQPHCEWGTILLHLTATLSARDKHCSSIHLMAFLWMEDNLISHPN